MPKRSYAQAFGPSTIYATKRQSLAAGPGRTTVRGNYRRRKRVYRPKRYTGALAKLTKQVKWNALKLHGAPQINNQKITWLAQSHSGDCRDQYPFLFDMTNFTSDNLNGTIPNSVCNPVYQMVASGSTFVPGLAGFFQRQNYKGLANNTALSMWGSANHDVPDTGKYYAVSSHYRITAACKGETRIRIQMFTVKPGYIGVGTNVRNFQLPDPFLDGLGFMTGGNQLNRKAFKKYKDVEKVISPINDQTGGNVVFEFSFKHMKMCEQYITNPAVAPTNPSGAMAPNNPNEADASGIYNASTWFTANNIPQAQPFWCLISTNATGNPGDTNTNQTLFTVQRTVRWRDHVG